MKDALKSFWVIAIGVGLAMGLVRVEPVIGQIMVKDPPLVAGTDFLAPADVGPITSPYLPRWLSALEQIERKQLVKQATFLYVGDSMAHRKPAAMRAFFRQKYGISGFVLDGVHTLTAGTPDITSRYGGAGPARFTDWEDGEVWVLNSADDSIQFSETEGAFIADGLWDNLTVYTVNTDGGGSYIVEYSTNEGSTWSTVSGMSSISTDAGSGNPDVAGISSSGTITRDVQRFRVRHLSGDVIVIGFKVWNSAVSGIIYGGIARGGLQMEEANTVDPDIFDPIIADIDPDLVLFENKDSLAQYTTDGDFEAYLTRWDDAGVTPDWSLVGFADGQANDTTSADIRAAIQAVAADRGNHYFDANAAMGGWTGITANGWDDPDPVHLDDDAHEVAATTYLNQTGARHTNESYFLDASVSDGGSESAIIKSKSTGHFYVRQVGQEEADRVYYYFIREEQSGSIPHWYIGLNANSGDYANGFILGGGSTGNNARFGMTGAGLMSIGYGIPAVTTERVLITETGSTRAGLRINHTNPASTNIFKVQNNGTDVFEVDNSGNVQIDNVQVLEERQAAVGDITTSASAGTLPTPDGTMTIADASTPTNAELLEYCAELEAKLELLLDRLGTPGHGLTSD
jgi:hypothetical protein